MSDQTMHTTFRCPKCKKTYVNPIPALTVAHKCRMGKRVAMKPVKEEKK